MQTIVFASQKGGSGKTTPAAHMAVQAGLAGFGNAATIDTDLQGLLREKDIMLPDDATTPMRLIYFTVMMLYLGEGQVKQHQNSFLELMSAFMNAISNAEVVA
ncbi:MAG: flagellar biosynthesis repressor FlbT [Alphaproteobacteria bacterium]